MAVRKVFKCPRCGAVTHELDVTGRYVLYFDENMEERREAVHEFFQCPNCFAEYPSKDHFQVTTTERLYAEWDRIRLSEEGEPRKALLECTDEDCGFRWYDVVKKTLPPCPKCGCEMRELEYNLETV